MSDDPSATAASPRGDETILVIDDDSSILQMVTEHLTALGYTVLEANGLEAAQQLAQEHGATIDLAITDVILGEHNGVEIVRRLREQRDKLPVIFISGLTDGVTGASDDTFFVHKPFTLNNLAAVTRHALDHSRL